MAHAPNIRFLDHKSEFYDENGNPLRSYLFHPATLAAIDTLGLEVLDLLVPEPHSFDDYIPDMQLYNTRMAKSMEDKVSHLRDLDAEVVVDIGCADGALLKFLANENPERHYIGYDISQPMVDLAREENPQNITFTTDWQAVIEEAQREAAKRGASSVLVLSSVLHEVLHYLGDHEVESFWEKVWESDFDMIAIRDMMVSETASKPTPPSDIAKVRQNYDPDKILQWEETWGPLADGRSMAHFLLTCPYEENWVRELQENYLPLDLQAFLERIPEQYEIAFFQHYVLPYHQTRTEERFDGLEVRDNTHMKMVLKKKDPEGGKGVDERDILRRALEATPPGETIQADRELSGSLEVRQLAEVTIRS